MCLKNHYFGHKTCCWASMRLKLRYVHIICIRISLKKKNCRSLNPPKCYEKRPLQPLIEAKIFFWCFHWIPGEILTYLKKKSFSVAPKTPKLACLKHLGPLPPLKKPTFFLEKNHCDKLTLVFLELQKNFFFQIGQNFARNSGSSSEKHFGLN